MSENLLTRECALTNMHNSLRSMLSRHIEPHDEILMCCESVLSHHLKNHFGQIITRHHLLLAVTNRHIDAHMLSMPMNYVSGGVYGDAKRALKEGGGEAVYSMPITEIQGIEEEIISKKRLFSAAIEWYLVRVNGLGGQEIVFVFGPGGYAQQFQKILRKTIGEKKELPLQANPSPAERLRELTAIYEEGLISEDEFSLKRQELLDQM